MIIRQAEIQKFGKLEKEQYRFSPQINIIYGPNESGKSTLMQFLKAMMYGLEKSRVRKMLDTYKKYEPWEAPAYFSGSMIFETGEQQFLLERNFYYKERSTRLVNIRDGEELSVEYGDLDMLLGNVSAGAYENTFCIGQEQSVPGRELGVLLEDERSNLAQTGSGDFPLSKALQNLEQKRKNKEKQKKELEQQRLADIRQLEVKQQMLESDIAVLKAQQKKQGTQKQNVQEQVKQLKQAAEPVLSEYRAVCRQEQELQKVIRQAQLNIERKHLKKEHLKKETEDGQKQKTEHQAGFSPLLLIGVAGLILAPILRTSLDGFQKIAPILNVICIVLILAGLISAYGRRRRLQEVEMEAEAIQEGAEAEYGDEEVYQKVVKQLTALQQKRSVLEQQIDTFREQRKALQMQVARQEGSGDQITGQIQEKEVEAANLADQMQELQFQTAEERAIDQDIQALTLSADTMQRLAAGMSKSLEHVLNRDMSEILAQITGNAHGQLQVSEGQGIVLSEQQKSRVPEAYSQGTMQQAYFAYRMAAGKLLAKEEPLPFLLDEAFAGYDTERLRQTLRWLAKQENQIFLFTCRETERELLLEEGIPFSEIRL